jgi:hypothetical protein
LWTKLRKKEKEMGEDPTKIELHIKLIGDTEQEWGLGAYLTDYDKNLLPESQIEKVFDKLCFSIRATLSNAVKKVIFNQFPFQRSSTAFIPGFIE